MRYWIELFLREKSLEEDPWGRAAPQAMGAGLAPGSQRLRTSSLGAGWGRTLQTVCVQARRGRLAPKKVTKGGIDGNSWCRGASTQSSTPS